MVGKLLFYKVDLSLFPSSSRFNFYITVKEIKKICGVFRNIADFCLVQLFSQYLNVSLLPKEQLIALLPPRLTLNILFEI